MNYQKGDIVLVNFPFSDLSTTKARPAAVLKDISTQNVLVCQITTKINPQFDQYETLLLTKDCAGGLKTDSIIRCDLIATLHKSLIQKKISYIKNKAIVSEVFAKLKTLLFA